MFGIMIGLENKLSSRALRSDHNVRNEIASVVPCPGWQASFLAMT